MSDLGFLLDENVPLALRIQLLRREPALRVSVVGHPGAPPKGTPDPDLLVWIEEQDCMLVTRNRASMPRHLHDYLASGRHTPGILILPMELSLGIVLDNLLLIRGASLPGEYQDLITYLPLR